MHLRHCAAVMCVIGLLGCTSFGGADAEDGAEISRGTTDGYAWKAVTSEVDGHPCVGFVVEDEPMGQACDTEGGFPDTIPVLDYVGTVVQGMDRTGFVFLARDDAAEVVVTFADGTEVKERFERSDDLDEGLLAVAFIGTPSADVVRVVVTDADGGRLADFETPPPPLAIP